MKTKLYMIVEYSDVKQSNLIIKNRKGLWRYIRNKGITQFISPKECLNIASKWFE